MSQITEKSFEEMSKSFQMAFGYSSIGHYSKSIPLYEKAIEEDKNNFAALNNIAVAKIHLSIQQKNINLLKEAIAYLKEAIRITIEVYKFSDGYPIAEGNLKWSVDELNKLENFFPPIVSIA